MLKDLKDLHQEPGYRPNMYLGQDPREPWGQGPVYLGL